MRIRLQKAAQPEQLDHAQWDLCLKGSVIDDRGRVAETFTNTHSTESKYVSYSSESFNITIANQTFNAEDTDALLNDSKNKDIILEATTLGFVEIFLCARALKSAGIAHFSLLYVEPGDYPSRPMGSPLLNRRDFDLSQSVPGFKPIPGATLVTTDRTIQQTIFFLGYEEHRLAAALENQIAEPCNTAVVFGVPAFSPGWEMNAFANNIRNIQNNNIRGGVRFCGAENPAAAFDLLEEIYRSLAETERLIVGPIGTKPNGVGVALFAAIHPEVGLLYDHPQRGSNRSKNVGGWHLYTVEF